MSRTRPYLLVAGDFVKTGGMDRANYALAEFLAKEGHEVHLVSHRVGGALLTFPNVIFHQVPRLVSNVLGGFLIHREGKRRAWELQSRRAVVLVNGGNCNWRDVNWVHYVHSAYPRHERAHGFERLKLRLIHQRALAEERATIPSSRVIIADSNRTRRDVIGLLGTPGDRVHTVYYGIDSDLFRPVLIEERLAKKKLFGWSLHKRHIAFVGGVGDQRKGFETVFAAWRRLCSIKHWKADLVVVGKLGDADHWRRRAESSGIADRIHFLGFRSDVPAILSACDALVSPTRYEPYGLGVHEALCCGLPAIVSRSAGVAERYTRELEDLLIDNADSPDELVFRLRNWDEHFDVFCPLVRDLSRILRAHTWDNMAQEMTTLMEQT